MTEQQTPDREKKIAEIREALEKATQGPWKWIDPGGLERKKLVGEWEIMNFGVSAPYSEIAGQEPDDADAHLIANAPEWLRFLLDEIDREREESRKLREERDEARRKAEEAWKEIDSLERLREERDKLIEVLRHYADRRNHPPLWLYNDGQRAREILKEIGVMDI